MAVLERRPAVAAADLELTRSDPEGLAGFEGNHIRPFGDAIEAFVQIENLLNEQYIADNSGFNPPLRGTPFTAFVGARMQLR